jgi:hypothetical protein
MERGLKDFKDRVNDPTMQSEYERIYLDHFDTLKVKYPDVDPEDLEYWASLLTFMGEAEEVHLSFSNPPPDPTKIRITIYPDYGS